MIKAIIEVNNISKKYIIHHDRQGYHTLRDTLVRAAKRPLNIINRPAQQPRNENFWALSNITFSVQPGETIGVIGNNGAGKSTLLKILSQITPPTTGTIRLRGRVASLLEVGTGFHPELTGRENIFLNGAILGMQHKEIRRKFDEIVAFAEVEKFIDTPVKRYSSGMYVRLAFAVAAHLEPEILIVDEVLAVGDINFQKKSLGKMGEVTREDGRTIIFVSHNMEAIRKICTKCILLKDGEIAVFDETNAVIQKYLFNHEQLSSLPLTGRKDREGDGTIQFHSIHITNLHSHKKIGIGDGLRIRVQYTSVFKKNIDTARIVFTIFNEDIQPVYRMDSDVTRNSFTAALKPEGEVACDIANLHLLAGRYLVGIDFLVDGVSRDYFYIASEFMVTDVVSSNLYKSRPDSTISHIIIPYKFHQ